MDSSRVPVNLVTGATGAGKSTAILRLLTRRAATERWAVLVNDFGLTKVTTATDDNVIVREVAGCICCTAQVALRTAIVKLLRETAPQRLLIEASGAARSAALVQVLRKPGIAKAVELSASICVIDPEQLSDRRYLENEVYREQIAEAAAIYVSKMDAGRGVERDRVQTELQALGSGSFVVFSDGPGLDIECVDAVAARHHGPC